MFGRMANTLDDLNEVDCLLCGSQRSCDRMLYSDREEWSRSICNLLNINDPQIVHMFAMSYYCGKCNDDLRKVNQILHQIAELQERLLSIKTKCVYKLDHCVEETKQGRCSTFPTHVQRRAHILPYLKGNQVYTPASSASQIVNVISDEIVRAMSNQMIHISPDQILVSTEHQHLLGSHDHDHNDTATVETEEMLSASSTDEQLINTTSEQCLDHDEHLLGESTVTSHSSEHLFTNQKIILSELDGTLSVELVMTDPSSQSENQIIHGNQITGPHPDSWFPQDNFVESEIEIKTDHDFANINGNVTARQIETNDNDCDSHIENVNCLPTDMESDSDQNHRNESENDSHNNLCPATLEFDQNRSIIEQAMELANTDVVESNLSCSVTGPVPVSAFSKTKALNLNSNSSTQNNFSETLTETELTLVDSDGELVHSNQHHTLGDPDEGVQGSSQNVSAIGLQEPTTNQGGSRVVYDEDAYPSDDENMHVDKDPFTLSDQEENYGSSVTTMVSNPSDGEYNSQATDPAVHTSSSLLSKSASSFSSQSGTEWDNAKYKELKEKYKLKELSIRLQRPWVIKIVNIASLLKQCNSTSETVTPAAATATPTATTSRNSPIVKNGLFTSGASSSYNNTQSNPTENVNVVDFFQCTVEGCRMRFRFEVQRDAHIKRLHEGVKRPYSCQICNITFVTYKQFSYHENAHEAKHPFQCITCSLSYEHRSELVDHIDQLGHHADSLLALPCTVTTCCKKFIDEIRRDAHVKKCHEGIKNPYECTVCCRKFTCYRYLKDHMNHHANVNPYNCEKCGRTFYSQLRLKEHIKCHGPKNLQCEYCGKEFVLKGRYNVHVRTHTKERPYACEVCGKRFTQRKYLRYHLPVHPELNLERAVCKICNKVFSHHQTLRIHELQHTGEFKYRCSICNFGAPSQYAVNNHMAKHTELREYACEMCCKKFKTSKYLKMHMKQQHAEDRASFDCKSCGKKLRSRIGLLRHEALHGDSFPFVCSKCGKCYPLKYYLDSHTIKCIKKESNSKEIPERANSDPAAPSTSSKAKKLTLKRKWKGRRPQPQNIKDEEDVMSVAVSSHEHMEPN